ncbi:CGNR zinc finger domain-containing protein [Actinophytocola gossypii]|uniref:CGNR zinc finger domain-containing protein n=1 Tax=Actinophytocola gossypii TaxID=2812003 RepID=A0ABT2JA86_9PSEU|nr:ABATE domain-containing protein [Actinophytocola gossypii]MCT2584777.1 CGNR zinc finger domain-containing protein [Actinophytocola gossypii]
MAAKVPPHAVLVDGHALPKPVAGHPALEFCNTWAGWGEPEAPGAEWLVDYDRFVLWAEFTGLVPASAAARLRGRAEDAVLARARALRVALYRILRHRDLGALDVLAAEADEANRHTRLTATTETVHFELVDDGNPLLPLRSVALSAVDLLSGPQRNTVRACPGDGCGWLFLDPRGRRVWCSMASCGNRAKVRAHAARNP